MSAFFPKKSHRQNQQRKHAMQSIFPKAHAYSVPHSIQESSTFRQLYYRPPLLFPYDIWINRFLCVWIMPCNHSTHLGLVTTVLIFLFGMLYVWHENCNIFWLSHHENSNTCYAINYDHRNWQYYWLPAMIIILIGMTLHISYDKVFSRFFNKPWMDPSITSKF